jgi:MEMO1 family protein
MTIRKSYFDGKFYSSDKELLKKQIKDCFLHPLGPNELPIDNNYQTVKGLILPHAGYIYSGMNAAHGFFKLKESGNYDLFILIGFSHSCAEKNFISISKKDWQTPFGIVKNDYLFGEELSKNDYFEIDENAFINEHSIEVMLPFLQYLYLDNLTILPLSISYKSNLITIKKIAKSINDVIKKLNKNVCFIVSSDFTHYGINFGFNPFMMDVEKNILKLDMDAIEFIKILDSEGFLDYIYQTDATICGKNAITLLMEILKNYNINKIELLKYYTSAKLTNDHKNSVSYASIMFESIKL